MGIRDLPGFGNIDDAKLPATLPRPFQDRFRDLDHDSWRILRRDHDRRALRGNV